jgi:hypothetical protein
MGPDSRRIPETRPAISIVIRADVNVTVASTPWGLGRNGTEFGAKTADTRRGDTVVE